MTYSHNMGLPSNINGLPTFESTSNLTEMANLSDFNVDEQMPQTIESCYFTIPELASLSSTYQDLSILHTNIRSLSLHHDELVSLTDLSKKSFDIIGVSEMWHSVQNPIVTNIDIEGYKFYKTKSLSQNGGVGLYVKTSLISTPCNELSFKCKEFETIWVEIEVKDKKNLFFCCAYRHPNSDIDIFTAHFESLLPNLINKRVFIMGDFNINLLNYDSHIPTNDFTNTLFTNNFLPCIHNPTRVSDHSATIIDNIFTNLGNSNVTCGNILTQISDHFPQFLFLKSAKLSCTKPKILKYDYSRFDERKFVEDFEKIDLTYLNCSSDAETNYNKFLEDVTFLVEKHVPIKKCTKREIKLRTKPWITSKIQKMMRIRARILKKTKKDRSKTNHDLYKKFRNRVAYELKKSLVNYFRSYFSINSQNMKKLWSGIKSIISNKAFTASSINKIKDENGNATSDPVKVSNILNNFFVKIADNITRNMPRTPKSPLDYITNTNQNSIFLSPVTYIEVGK